MVHFSTISRQSPVSYKNNPVNFTAKKNPVKNNPAKVENAPVLEHNLNPKEFNWLFARYVTGMNDKHHCTNGFKGPYSDKIGAPDRLKRMGKTTIDSTIKFDEQPVNSYDALYICGVAKKGYNKGKGLPYWEKENYKHNLHIAIKPAPGQTDEKTFNDKWHLKLKNGKFLNIPGEDELPEKYKKFCDDFKKCRMFRWAACFYEDLKKDKS